MNVFRLTGINSGVRHFRNLFFALAAFLWLPAAAHCQLEALSGLEFFQCSAGGSAPCGPLTDCDCSAAEKFQLLPGHLRLTSPAPLLTPLGGQPQLKAASPRPNEIGGETGTPPPPRLKTWQFYLRSALPIRAPALAS